VISSIGWRHWAACLITFAVLRRFLQLFGTEEGSLIPRPVVQRFCRNLISGLEWSAPNNTAQLLRAACLVSQIAKKFDSGLSVDIWGIRGGGMPFGWGVQDLVQFDASLGVLLDSKPRLYLATHNLERLFTQMINQILFTKPANPKMELILFLADRVPLALLEENGILLKGTERHQSITGPIAAKFLSACQMRELQRLPAQF